MALAGVIPAGKFAWRPGPGVRSTSEVFMHITGDGAGITVSHPADTGAVSSTGPSRTRRYDVIDLREQRRDVLFNDGPDHLLVRAFVIVNENVP